MIEFRHWKQWLKENPGDAAIVIGLALVGLMVGIWASVIVMDDAMITFRVAENLAFGRGFVFNPGERVQVTTTPLYTMLLVPGVWILGSAPVASLWLNLTLAAVMPVLAYIVGRRLTGRLTGIGGALFVTIAPFMVMSFSMESYLYATLILASVAAYVYDRYSLAGVLVGVTALTRGDAALSVAVLLGYDVVARRRLSWRLILPAIAVPAGWYLFALFYFGSPFPATLAAKTAQGDFNWLRMNFIEGMQYHIEDWTHGDHRLVYYSYPLFLLLGLVPALWQERPWLILIGRDVLYGAVFVILNVPAAEWYYAPLMPGAALLTARGIQFAAEGIGWLVLRRRRMLIAIPIAILVMAEMLWVLGPMSAKVVRAHPDWKARSYPAPARWIAQHTSPEATLSTIDIGHIGYWSGRHIIDIVGLAQPDVSEHIAQGDFGYAIRQYQPDLILLGYLWLDGVQQMDWFQQNYVRRRLFKAEAMDQPLVLFSRRDGVNVAPAVSSEVQITPLDKDFNRQITLTGYALNQPLQPGDDLELTLFWQVEAPIEVDFTVFVQLVQADNTIVAQRDGRPQNGFFPTPAWQPGEQVVDRHTVPLPADLAGHYDLLVGLYEPESGARLQILDEAGQFQSDHVRITDLRVQP